MHGAGGAEVCLPRADLEGVLRLFLVFFPGRREAGRNLEGGVIDGDSRPGAELRARDRAPES